MPIRVAPRVELAILQCLPANCLYGGGNRLRVAVSLPVALGRTGNLSDYEN